MNAVLRIRLLAFGAVSSALAFALAGAGCGGDVTGAPDGPVATNTEESTSSSTINTREPAEGAESASKEKDRAIRPKEDKATSSKEPAEQQPKYTGPPPAVDGMGSPGAGGGEGRRQGGILRAAGRLLKQLDLSDAQKAKIKAITEEAAKEFQALRKSQDAQQGNLREKFQRVRDATMKKIEAVLTPEQREKLEKLKEEAAAQMRERMRERGGQPGTGTGGSGGRQGPRSVD